MANKIRAKLILELRAKGQSRKSIVRSRGMSMHSVMAVFDAADELGIRWDDVKDLDDAEVYAKVFPKRAAAEMVVVAPDYDYVHSELKKTGVTLKLLWEEHRDRCAEESAACTSYSTFNRGYAEYVLTKNVTNHLEHKPGQVMEVDWSGSTMRLVNPATGEISKVYLFVATLPYSQYGYVEATLDMKQDTWLSCHVHAYEFIGGVPVRTVCDNLKTGVIKHPKEGEIVLNEAYESLARHYVTAIMPTGVRKLKQKPSVEGMVGKIATAVIAKLRGTEFATLDELNAAIAIKVNEFNAAPFQKRDGSRAEVFKEVELCSLAPLPAAPYEICKWVYGRSVNLDFHVVYETNRYSVPYSLVGKKVDLKVTQGVVEAFDHGSRVATHPRFPNYVRYRCHTEPQHMPPEFARPEWDDKRMLRWAREIGAACETVVSKVFDGIQIKEQAYNPALSILNLSKRYGAERLESACAYALEKTASPRYRFLRTVLASQADLSLKPAKPAVETGGYVRGAEYYAGKEEC
ncbi:MAG: IS21 family transposase [Gordonibacter sp.]|nr:IS21 family transposase [Gordonibacter sp.]